MVLLRVKFDENGVSETESSLENRFHKDIFTTFLNDENLEEYANLDILYIVPQDFEKYNDVFTNDMKDYYVSPDYLILILIIGAISVLLLTIAAFAVPYKTQNKMAICRGFNKIFLELKLFTWALFSGVFFITGINVNIHSYYRGKLLTNIIYDVHPYFYAIGIPITFILYLLIYLNIVYIKHIYYTGFKKGVIDNSLIGKILIQCKEILKTITAIDSREDNERKLLAITGINLLAILILGSNGFLGFI